MFVIILSILSYDIWFYISHILLHKREFYHYHKEHHTKRIPIFIDTYLSHVLEGPIQGIGTFIPFLVYDFYIADFIIIIILLNLRGMMRHDERCVFLIGNHHLLHHKYPNYNFGEYWIDTLCGTKYPNDREYKRGLIYV